MLVLEAALLIEEGYGEICDELWYIYASEEVRRKDLSHQEAIQMRRLTVSLQASLKKLSTEGTARRVIDNDGDIENTIASINKALSKYKE